MALTRIGISGAPTFAGAAPTPASLIGAAPLARAPYLKFCISFCIACIMASNCAGLGSACATCSGVGLASAGCPLVPE